MNLHELSVTPVILFPNKKVEQFFEMSHEALNIARRSWPVGACIEAEERWMSVFTFPINGSGDILHPIIDRTIATITIGSVHDSDNWTQLALHTQTPLMVKNLSCDPLIQSVIGERNALTVLNGIAFLALMDTDNHARIVRPFILPYQRELQKKFATAMSATG